MHRQARMDQCCRAACSINLRMHFPVMQHTCQQHLILPSRQAELLCACMARPCIVHQATPLSQFVTEHANLRHAAVLGFCALWGEVEESHALPQRGCDCHRKGAVQAAGRACLPPRAGLARPRLGRRTAAPGRPPCARPPAPRSPSAPARAGWALCFKAITSVGCGFVHSLQRRS